METDYSKYRGRCREMAEAAVRADPTLILVRGRYICPIWNEQNHWWTIRSDGTIFDPTKDQFPSKGIGEYVPFNGIVNCSQCGREGEEKEFSYEGNYAFCSDTCHMLFVGLGEYIR